MTIKIPIGVAATGEIMLFADVPALENALEAIDVQNREYIGYDSEGSLISLTTAFEPRTSFFGFTSTVEVVKVAGIEATPVNADSLATKISAFLARYASKALQLEVQRF